MFLSKNLEALDKTFSKFWEIKEIENQKNCFDDELKYCNEHFDKTHFRKPDGRYVVEMPFKPDLSEDLLGDSKLVASKRLDQLWARLERDPNLKTLYSEFLNEYELSNHMKEIKEDTDDSVGYYLPHHGVLRPTSKTTKLRVVFNASSQTTSGYSLNDLLSKGGILQDDLFSILIRFRKHVYAFTADIKQMFRMIEINPSQTKLQKILWKEGKSSPIKVFQLRTVTYGTASAPYLATRVLQQLAKDESLDFPLASKTVLQDFYMDDCLSGSSDELEFEKLQSELSQLLLRGGMSLHKCRSNKLPIPELQEFPLDRNSDEIVSKTLGMLWNNASDCFTYQVSINANRNYTKREVLSQIARIYDPLGLLGPVTAKAKIFMQQLWLLKLNWNEPLPPDVCAQWEIFVKNLPDLEYLQIPRCVLSADIQFIELHGFADASSKCYAAVIYVHTVSNTNASKGQLLCSKSRVAPIKLMTIPRLELSACLLLAKLIKKVLSAIKMEVNTVKLWSDSSIALAWINTPPNLLKTFVGNRVSQIQQLTEQFQWQHVPSQCNPADLVSRGLDVKHLTASELWWKGPNLFELNECTSVTLQKSRDFSEKLYTNELKPISMPTLTIKIDCDFYDNFLNISNNFQKLIRILAFIFRFIANCKSTKKEKGALNPAEYANAENCLIKMCQVRYFRSELSLLKEGHSVGPASKLKFLNPFLDKNGLIRVGGRLSHSNESFDRKHPIVLPASDKLVKLIFSYYHKRDLHVGPQALLNTIRSKYWPLNGRTTARKVVHECIDCFKMKPILANQLMGNLPSERVTPSSPFLNVGLDLCGPFEIKYKGQRKGTFQKIYVAIFVCMATKAVHLEFVSDLTSESVIATLRRFFSRRGKSSIIFSDNATNFTGASKELKRLHQLVVKSEDISSLLASEGIRWKFLPPRAPNFGGLWEAGVKSFKHHLKRVVGSTKLTLEEFLTIMIQIEGILNSRPLSPLSTDVDDFQVLTPGHFLVGRPVNSVPEPNLTDQKDNLLNRWKKVQKITQTIWKRWQNNYLSHLQQRNKWLFERPNIIPGMLVLLKETQLPICTWSLGRITNVIPGPDGKVRVADVQTSRGNFRRPISKISILPIDYTNSTAN